MKISNLRIFKNPRTKIRLCTYVLTGVMCVSTLVGCFNSKNSDNNLQYIGVAPTTVFETGEHIVSIPVDNPAKEIRQYDYYDGYKCVGLGTSAYGELFKSFGGAYALYVNEYAVECTATGVDDLNLPVYESFGVPVDFEKSEEPTTATTKDFGIGEHIISVPIDNPGKGNAQHVHYEGYEPIDIAVAAYGNAFNCYGGGAIMYANTVPVRCEVTAYDEENKGYYLSFGTPIEVEKVLTK